MDWGDWYNETLDALISALEGATGITWGTDVDGNTWVIAGDAAGSGLEYPAAFVPTFRKSQRADQSDRDIELHTITAEVLVMDEGDTKDREANLRDAIDLMAKVENALYSNRDLPDGNGDSTCKRLTVTDSNPLSQPTETANLHMALLTVEIMKEADHA